MGISVTFAAGGRLAALSKSALGQIPARLLEEVGLIYKKEVDTGADRPRLEEAAVGKVSGVQPPWQSKAGWLTMAWVMLRKALE